MAAAAGYEPVYKGKLHIMAASGPNDTAVPEDAGQYGWTRYVLIDSQGGQYSSSRCVFSVPGREDQQNPAGL